MQRKNYNGKQIIFGFCSSFVAHSRREAESQMRFRELLFDDNRFYVPQIIPELSTKRILTAEMVSGKPLDKIMEMDQATRNWVQGLLRLGADCEQVAARVMELCLREVFEFRFMQTDPNWSNFFYQAKKKRVILSLTLGHKG